MCEERTDDASRNLARTKSTDELRRSVCEKLWARLSFLVLSATLTTFEAKESINR
jgi:hypothetical protein